MAKTMKNGMIGPTHVVIAACALMAGVALGVEPPPGVMGSVGWNFGGLNCGCFPKEAGGPPICDTAICCRLCCTMAGNETDIPPEEVINCKSFCNPCTNGAPNTGPFPCWRSGGESCDIVCQTLRVIDGMFP